MPHDTSDPALAVPAVFRLATHPLAEPAAVVLGPHVRFTVLTSQLLRLEFSPTDAFEDRPSQPFWYRRQPTPQFAVQQTPQRIEITTAHLHLRYDITSRGFHRQTLAIDLLTLGKTWRYGDDDWRGNLRGAARTLDEANGRVRLEPGLMSRSGWAVVDDSATLVFDEQGWLAPRGRPGNLDLYFFGYGHDYPACLADFCRVAGSIPLIPRWMLGNWWSRYWAYSQEELQGLMTEFRSHDVPLSVCIVDMDWHITQTGNPSFGWTGYTWNRELFPDPAAFLSWLHEQGLKTSLNLHPADGVWPHEAQYAAMARRLGLDPTSEEPIPFDLADPAFAAAYFELLHHPQEVMGVDFWWIDWQQGAFSKLPGLDPLWWLNHLHFLDLGRSFALQTIGHTGVPTSQSTSLPTASPRPVIFSRWGGLGNHRYPIGFSGDTVVSWESLAFQPQFTATAANVGYGWWSHDIGGHMGGVEDRELYTRWVQYGVFSPILRLHSTKNPYHERRPWGWDDEVFRITRDALQLRHALIPYLYSMAWRATTQALPLCLPMYWLHPEDESAYACPNQYYFGSELIAAPFVTPAETDTRLSRQAVWLPEGDWFDFFSGEHVTGGGWRTVYGGLADIPVFAKAGAIVPMGSLTGWCGVGNPSDLTVVIFPGANNTCELYEDDGETTAYQQGRFCVTRLRQAWYGDRLLFTIDPAEGDASLVPTTRHSKLIVRGIKRPEDVELLIDGRPISPVASYDWETETLTIDGAVLHPGEAMQLTVVSSVGSLLSPRNRRPETARKLLRAFRLDSWVKQDIDRDLPDLLANPASLMRYSHNLAAAQLHALQNVLGQLS